MLLLAKQMSGVRLVMTFDPEQLPTQYISAAHIIRKYILMYSHLRDFKEVFVKVL